MKFAHPEILWALIALAIPVIVHLFNFRRFKRVAFSNVSFLREVQQETKSRSRLKHLLILLSRLLAIFFLVMAFAQPYQPLDDSEVSAGKRNVSVYIDNSFSMDARNEEGRLLDLSKAKAAEVVAAYQATDVFQLLTNDLEGRHQRFHSQEDVLEMIDEVEVSSATRRLDEILQRQQDQLLSEPEGSSEAFIFSDLQQSTHRLAGFAPDSSISLRFIPDRSARAANVWIDSLWFETPVRLPNQSEKLHLRIRHSATEQRENIPMKLEVNGKQKAIGSFNLTPGTYTDTTLYFTLTEPGFKNCEVSIQDHPITYDDRWYFGFDVARMINVMLVRDGEEPKALRNVFGNDPFYRLQEVDIRNLNYGEFPRYDLIVLDRPQSLSSGLLRELSGFMSDGGTVLFFPSSDGDLTAYNELLPSGGLPPIESLQTIDVKVNDLNLAHPLYEGVFDRIPENIDLPKVQRYFRFSRTALSSSDALMRMQNGDPFILAGKQGDGQLYASAVSLAREDANFAQHAIFVPTVLRIAEFSRPSGKTSYTIGSDAVIRLRKTVLGGDAVFRFRKRGSEEGFIPRHRSVKGGTEIFMEQSAIGAGNYELYAGDSLVMATGMNYSRDESELASWSIAEWEEQLVMAGWSNSAVLKSDIDTVSKLVQELDSGEVFWDVMLLLALTMLIIELLLIKFWKS